MRKYLIAAAAVAAIIILSAFAVKDRRSIAALETEAKSIRSEVLNDRDIDGATTLALATQNASDHTAIRIRLDKIEAAMAKAQVKPTRRPKIYSRMFDR